MKRFALLMFVEVLVISFNSQPVLAGEVDILIEKLVEKRILTQSEANELLKEIEKEAAEEKVESGVVPKEAAKKEKVKLPQWVEKMKLKGDLRLRYQGQERDQNGAEGTHWSRGRFRYRLGVETEVNEQWTAGFGIASGGDDPRSTNVTMDNVFSSKGIRIDYAYAQYEPSKWLKLLGGKFKNPLWQPKDLLWDSDIRVEGLAGTFRYKLYPSLEFYTTPAFLIVEESGGKTDDSVMWAFQAGINWKFRDKMYLKFASSYYATDNFRGNAFGFSSGDNTTDPSGNLVFEYNALAADAEIGFEIPGPVHFLAIFGQYVNSDADDSARPTRIGEDDNEGWLWGIKFGHKKIEKFGQWIAKYNYRHLEQDAWPDFFPDSDFYSGATNSKGHEVEFIFGIHKNVTLGADYYKAKQIRGPENEEDLIQLDLMLEF